jgi:hypothetical protein
VSGLSRRTTICIVDTKRKKIGKLLNDILKSISKRNKVLSDSKSINYKVESVVKRLTRDPSDIRMSDTAYALDVAYRKYMVIKYQHLHPLLKDELFELAAINLATKNIKLAGLLAILEGSTIITEKLYMTALEVNERYLKYTKKMSTFFNKTKTDLLIELCGKSNKKISLNFLLKNNYMTKTELSGRNLKQTLTQLNQATEHGKFKYANDWLYFSTKKATPSSLFDSEPQSKGEPVEDDDMPF